MYDVWVTSQSSIMKNVLDGISAFFNGNGGELMMYVTVVTGFFVLVAKYIIQPSIKQIMTWLLIVALVPSALIEMKESVIIHDTTSSLEMYTVDNVPLGLALPLSVVSSVMNSIMETTQDALHTPNDPSYTETGMVYASKLFSELKSVKPSPELATGWSEFMYQCVDPDVRVRYQYTYDDLFDAPDMMAFLKDHTINGFNRVHLPWISPTDPDSSSNWPRCSDALASLETRYKNELPWFYKTMGSYDPLNKAKTATEIQNDINGVYGYFFGLSADSEKNMMQNLLINASRNGFSNIASKNNQSAAAINYSYTQNEMSSMATWMTIGMMAQEYIPMLQTILLMILCCAFIPIVYVSLFPTYTIKVLVKYVESLLWVTSWGLFYVFINFIMTSFMRYRLDGFISIWEGITMSNIDATAGLMSKYCALTGYLLMFTPYLARLVTIGAANTFSGLTTSIQSGIASNAAIGARAISTGDYSLFNTNTANHSANNASFNKQNFDQEMRFGNESRSLLNGGSETIDAMGHQYHDNRVSGLATHINQSQAVNHGLQQSIANHENKAYSESIQAQKSWSTLLSKLSSVNENQAMRNATQASQGSNESMNVDQAYANMIGLTHRYGKDAIEAESQGHNFNEGAGVTVGTSKVPILSWLGINGEGHAKFDFNQSATSNSNNTSSLSAEDQKTLRQSMSVLQGASKSEIASAEKHFGIDRGHSIQANITEAQSHSQNAANEYRLAQDDQEAANYAESKGSSVTYNDIPQFESWLEERVGQVEANNYLNSPVLQGGNKFKGYVNEYEQVAASKFKENYLSNKNSIQSTTELRINEESRNNVGTNHDGIISKQEQNEDQVNQQYTQEKGKFEHQVQTETHNKSFNADNPSSFNRQMVIPPKMSVSIDQKGNALHSKVDALKSEVMDQTGNKSKAQDKDIESALANFQQTKMRFM
ncbi:conjugal transfer protein TraG N-terminal domain-containing protein [Thiotrichales bacterium 19S11-10]|nr:conjugal transfer protein TraG N-terminal domain-containing protein [Thiotrichales bacterium 19S11-10]